MIPSVPKGMFFPLPSQFLSAQMFASHFFFLKPRQTTKNSCATPRCKKKQSSHPRQHQRGPTEETTTHHLASGGACDNLLSQSLLLETIGADKGALLESTDLPTTNQHVSNRTSNSLHGSCASTLGCRSVEKRVFSYWNRTSL